MKRDLCALFACAVCLGALRAEPTPLAEAMGALFKEREALRGVPFSEVVKAATGHVVRPLDPERDATVLEQLATAIRATVAALNDPAHPAQSVGRVNEASRFFEEELQRQIAALPGWTCAFAPNRDGREQRSGYPDLRAEHESAGVIYLDPKLYAAGSEGSSLRTFYYEPPADGGKIRDDAAHLLVGFEHDSRRVIGWKLVDLATLRVRLKAEFQASNADLYGAGATILGVGR